MSPVSPFQVTIVQHPPIFLDVDASLEKPCALVGQTAEEGANVVFHLAVDDRPRTKETFGPP